MRSALKAKKMGDPEKPCKYLVSVTRPRDEMVGDDFGLRGGQQPDGFACRRNDRYPTKREYATGGGMLVVDEQKAGYPGACVSGWTASYVDLRSDD